MKTLLTAVLFSTLLGGLAQAQKLELGVFGGYPRMNKVKLGSISPESPADDDTRLKGQYSQGAWLGLNTRGYYGHEFNYMITRATLRTTVRTLADDVTTVTTPEDRIVIHQAGYNFLIYFMPNGSHWRPYVTGGLQATQYQGPKIADWPSGSRRHYGANYGFGIKLIPFAHALLRLDIRDYIGGKPYDLSFVDSTRSGGKIHQYEGAVGFAITF